MKAHVISRAGAAAALLGAFCGAPGLQAQSGESPYSYTFKLRAGLVAGDLRQTHWDNKVMGMAAEARRGVSDLFGINGALSAEVAFEYVPGRHHDVYPWGTNPIKGNDGVTGLNPRRSFDDRKEYGQGVNLRLAYSAPLSLPYSDVLGIEGLEWFAGLGLDMFKVATEVAYTFNFTPDSDNPSVGNYDGNRFVEFGTAFVPGVFGGLRCSVTKEVGFELTLRNFGMRTFEYIPGPYTSKNPAMYGKKEYGQSTTGTSRGWAIEFALAVKL